MAVAEIPFRIVSILHTAKALKTVHDKHGIDCSEVEYERLYAALINQFKEAMPDKELADEMLEMPVREIGKLLHSSPD